MIIIIYTILFLIVSNTFAHDKIISLDYVSDTINVSDEDEYYISNMYKAFLNLTAKNNLKKGIKFPVNKKNVVERDNHTIFILSYYISPNELRGFEISIPNKYLKKEKDHFITTTELSIDSQTAKSMIKIFGLKQAPDNKKP